MPIRPELRHLYPENWTQISRHVRFVRAKGVCEKCKRPHLTVVRALPGGMWFDEAHQIWRDGRGRRRRRGPDLLAFAGAKRTKVVLAACHIDGDLGNRRLRNLGCWCQRCHLVHDRAQHQAQRWLSYRRRYAIADLFMGAYEELVTARAIDSLVA